MAGSASESEEYSFTDNPSLNLTIEKSIEEGSDDVIKVRKNPCYPNHYALIFNRLTEQGISWFIVK